MRVREIEDNLLHPVSELGEYRRILVVRRGEVSIEQRLEHDYGFVEVPDEYPLGSTLPRVRWADTVSASALSPTALAGLRSVPCIIIENP